jgi:nucleoside-diphosphate-sugar epimerase
MKIAVTGATGFIGSELVNYLTIQGHEVWRLQRQQVSGPLNKFYDIRSIYSIPDLTGFDALIHTAFIKYNKKNIPDSSEFNIATTLTLEEACHRSDTKFIFLSTLAAHADSLSHYGKHKYYIEQHLNLNRSLVFKLGVVIGKKGLFDSIKTTISKGNFIPLVDNGSQPIQTIAVKDICNIIELSIKNNITGIYALGSQKVYTLKDLYTAIGQKLGKKTKFISLPYWCVNLGLVTMEVLRIPFKVSTENLLGLKQLKAFDTSADLKKLNITILDMDEALNELIK